MIIQIDRQLVLISRNRETKPLVPGVERGVWPLANATG